MGFTSVLLDPARKKEGVPLHLQLSGVLPKLSFMASVITSEEGLELTKYLGSTLGVVLTL